MVIDNYRFSVRVQTGEDGTADIVVKIPGTFNGMNASTSDGRFFSSALIWAEDPVNGDKITDICVKDLDGVIIEAARVAFPDYPIVGYSIDPEIDYEAEGNESIHPSLWLNGSRPIEIGPANMDMPKFIPSGLYICAKFVAGTVASGRTLNANFLWTKRT